MTDVKLRTPDSDEDLFAIFHAQQSVLKTFATAMVRSHPDPAALLAELEKTIAEDREDEIDFDELTPANQLGYQYAQVFEQMLVRITRNRLSA